MNSGKSLTYFGSKVRTFRSSDDHDPEAGGYSLTSYHLIRSSIFWKRLTQPSFVDRLGSESRALYQNAPYWPLVVRTMS